MSNDTVVIEHDPEGHELDADHQTDVHYVRIAIVLAVLTGIEVGLSYSGADKLALIVPLLVVMAIKFGLVAAHFMHLKFDDRLLARLFYFGLGLAVVVYVIVLSTLHVFIKP